MNRKNFIRNISNQHTNIILKEKYFGKSESNLKNLNEIFDKNFLKINEKIINDFEEKRKNTKSSQSKNINSTKFSYGFFDEKRNTSRSGNSLENQYFKNKTLTSFKNGKFKLTFF